MVRGDLTDEQWSVLEQNCKARHTTRPDLPSSLAETQALLARYTGTRDDAEGYGRELIGLYNVLENYNQLSPIK
ncbi:hypothetical protein ACIRQP_35530 [Streptomyces sp. NPDC102274]|uniref:hypothetical protein n=1 Tax=Streptomyces sp. NPDC102274 TaxID=3366151 RepID=UPI0038175E6A